MNKEPDGILIDPNYTPHQIPEHCLRLGTRKSYVADNNTTPKKEKTHVSVPRKK